VTAKQLAVMGATLANGGINPLSNQRVLDSKYVPKVLAIMMMAGFYDESGLWAYTAGLPAKTGVGGGIVAVVPGKMAIVGFSPRVNEAGNSVRSMNHRVHQRPARCEHVRQRAIRLAGGTRPLASRTSLPRTCTDNSAPDTLSPSGAAEA
jgi:hypothetical protein